MIDFSLSQVVQRHRHFRPGRAHAPDVSLVGFQVTHCPPFCFCVRHIVSVSAILFLCPPFCFCVCHFVSVSTISFLCPPFFFFFSVPAILFLCPPFCFCASHFVSVSAILFLGGMWSVIFFLCQPFSFFCVRHFVSVSAPFFLFPSFCFQVLPFCLVRLQIFLTCSYSISSFLSKNNSDCLFIC